MDRLLWLALGCYLLFDGLSQVKASFDEPETPITATCADADLAALNGHVVQLTDCGAAYAEEPPVMSYTEVGTRTKVRTGESYYSPIRARPPDGEPARIVAWITEPSEKKLFERLYKLSDAQQQAWFTKYGAAVRWIPHSYLGRLHYPARVELPKDVDWSLSDPYAAIVPLPVPRSRAETGWMLALGALMTAVSSWSIARAVRRWNAERREPAPVIRQFRPVPETMVGSRVKIGGWSWLTPFAPNTASRGAFTKPEAAAIKQPPMAIVLWIASRAIYVVACVAQRFGWHAWTRGIPFLGFLEELFEPFQMWARALDRRRRSLLARGVDRVLVEDPRPPVLLLRSFKDDGRHGDGKGTAPVDGWLTFEELIVAPLSWAGPVIAIGRPGERLPMPGAAREYVTHEDWKRVVEDRMSQAVAIVLVLGQTPGLAWELAKIRAAGHLSKLILVIPNISNREAKRRMGVLCTGLPDADDFGDRLYASLCDDALAIAFDGENPIVYSGLARNKRFYFGALERAIQDLRARSNQTPTGNSQDAAARAAAIA